MDAMPKVQKKSRASAASSSRKPARQAITLRLDPEQFRRLELLARAENRTPTNFVETAVLRDMATKEEAARAITMLVAEDAVGLIPGPLVRSPGESDQRYAERSAVMDKLFAIPDMD